MYLGSAPKFKVSGRDNEQRAIDDFEVHNLLGRWTESLLERDDLRPPICHIHVFPLLFSDLLQIVTICDGSRISRAI